jgi:hypothetical protein
MGGAYAVATCDRGQALYWRIEQTPERLCLCLAKLRVFGRDVRDRAVMLAKLLT